MNEFDGIKADYEAAKRSGRFQRRRRGVPQMGAGGDYHYRNEADFVWMTEVARDMCRNDPLIGQLVERAVINWLGTGLMPDPDTGDEALDTAIKDRWLAELEDPDYWDVAGEMSFHEIEMWAGRELLIAGDAFGVFTEGGTVQMLESHRCRSPQRTERNIVHGVELDRTTRRRLRYWFTKESSDPFAEQSRITIKDLKSIDARDAEGEALVAHISSLKRSSQTRGVTALAPIITAAGMFDDLNFANLLKAQLNAFWLLVRQRDPGFFESNPGMQRLGVYDSTASTTRQVEALAPGAEIASNPGETIQPWNPNTPPAEFFNHARLIITLIGINLGMPHVLATMDASDTNFSGYRGAVDQARMVFKHNQRILRLKLHRPFYRHKVLTWSDSDPVLAGMREKLGEKFLAHKWSVPGIPYIEPLKDAQADLIRLAHTQSSPRRIAMERGCDWDDIVEETAVDRGSAIRRGCTEAQKLNSEFKLAGNDVVSWRDIVPLPTPTGVSIALAGEQQTQQQSQNAKPAT